MSDQQHLRRTSCTTTGTVPEPDWTAPTWSPPVTERIAVKFTTGNDPDPGVVWARAYQLFREQGYSVDPEKIEVEQAPIDQWPSREVERMVADDVRGVLFRTVYGYRKVTQREFTGVVWIAWADTDQPLGPSDE